MVDAKTLLIILVLVALVVLIVFAVLLLRKLMSTLEHANKILEDVEVISAIAAARSKDIDGIVENVSGSVAEISGALKGNQSTIGAIMGLAKSAASLKGVFDKSKKKD